jgi:hypothetical protein
MTSAAEIRLVANLTGLLFFLRVSLVLSQPGALV